MARRRRTKKTIKKAFECSKDIDDVPFYSAQDSPCKPILSEDETKRPYSAPVIQLAGVQLAPNIILSPPSNPELDVPTESDEKDAVVQELSTAVETEIVIEEASLLISSNRVEQKATMTDPVIKLEDDDYKHYRHNAQIGEEEMSPGTDDFLQEYVEEDADVKRPTSILRCENSLSDLGCDDLLLQEPVETEWDMMTSQPGGKESEAMIRNGYRNQLVAVHDMEESLQRKDKELLQKDQEIEELRRQLEDLTLQHIVHEQDKIIERRVEVSAEIYSDRERFSELELSNRIKEGKLESAEEEISRLKELLLTTENSLENLRADYDRRLDEIQEEIEVRIRGTKEGLTADFERRMVDFKETVIVETKSSAEKEFVARFNQLIAGDYATIDELHARCKEELERIEDLTDVLAETEKKLKFRNMQISDLEDVKEDLEEDNMALRQQLLRFEAESESLNRQYSELATEITRLRELVIPPLESLNVALAQDRDGWKSRAQEEMAEKELLKQESQSLIVTKETALKCKEELIGSLKEKLRLTEDATKRIDETLKAVRERHEEERRKAENDEVSLNEKIGCLKQQLNELQILLNDERRTREFLTKTIEEWREKKRNADRIGKSVQAALVRQEAELEEARKEISALRDSIDKSNRLLSQYKQQQQAASTNQSSWWLRRLFSGSPSANSVAVDGGDDD